MTYVIIMMITLFFLHFFFVFTENLTATSPKEEKQAFNKDGGHSKQSIKERCSSTVGEKSY